MPTQAEFSAEKGWVHLSTVVAHFSSWSAAITEAGFLPNSASIGRICRAKDGHLCRSHAEILIDNWLFERDIAHEKEVRYPESKLVADWVIGSTFVEYLGIDMTNENPISQEYAQALARKKANLCRVWNSPLRAGPFGAEPS